MLVPSDEVFRWIADLTDQETRRIVRCARNRRADDALMAAGGLDILENVRNRLQAHVDRETYASMKQAERRSRAMQKKVRQMREIA